MTIDEPKFYTIDQCLALLMIGVCGAAYGVLFATAWPVLIIVLCLHAVQICLRIPQYYCTNHTSGSAAPEPFRIMANNRVLSVKAEWAWLLFTFIVVVIGVTTLRGAA